MYLEKKPMFSDARTNHQKTITNIFFTYYHLVDKMNKRFKKYHVTRQQFNVLYILKCHRPHHASVNLIKTRMLDKMSDVSRIVERLRLKGLVLRQSGTKDKREVEVIITQKGLNLVEQIDPELDNLGEILGNLTAQESATLNSLLKKIQCRETSTVLRRIADLHETSA